MKTRGSGNTSGVTKTSGRGSNVIVSAGRAAVIINAKMLERAFQALSVEPNHQSLFVKKLSLIDNLS